MRGGCKMNRNLKIVPINTGEADVKRMLDIFWSLSTETGVVTVPILTFLIQGAEAPILVDTGFREPENAMKIMKLGPHRARPEWDLVQQLINMGVQPEEIRYILLTHMHYEHCGKCHLFPNAKIIVQKSEMQEAAAPLAPQNLEVGGKALFYDRQDVATITNELWDRVILIDGDEEIVPGVRCKLFRNSHTPGSQAVYVDTPGGTSILLGDIARNVRLNIELQIPPGLYYDLRSMQATLAQLLKDGRFFYPTHDYEVLRRFEQR
jgi:glyoxylase-like metal-dependent hydrolase (beta-lactamase superfamily II)